MVLALFDVALAVLALARVDAFFSVLTVLGEDGGREGGEAAAEQV